ncbi:DNA-3-methyladenine glycosylase I [Mobilibacterium timonense]|uniref:DNA-3-methyladenine glycosylase I n=1 Tax=Mobilibacterium timonense TaxID=1871012 RepID=UPI002353AF33|nr:DNA-3-methyladenine glycosylase I [Mobilibacterium timonense]MBM6991018.1 DNA-3-methyladenine glycosylase I [Mobilibacterium timonense]
MSNSCGAWYEGDPVLENYHENEWCKVSHDDRFQFEMLCLEGASTGLSWKTIMHKRAAYRAAFNDFSIEACAAMTDEELEKLLSDASLIRNRSKIFSVRRNARAVRSIQEEFGSFDAYLWSFTEGRVIDGYWADTSQIPVESDVSREISSDMKKRGMSYVGPVITYSFMQAIGMVNDHLINCPYR